MGEGGEIFVLDLGEPIQIAYLVEQMIRLSAKVPGEDIEITYTVRGAVLRVFRRIALIQLSGVSYAVMDCEH